ncbi:MAG: toll/interleukin-1 receptor domain-containing protein, partial [Rhodothermaceae bacterium]|nr:toll/interleukin-1 receptor domain-containing protein [Rhodothermaceae bacterium]
MNNTDKKLDIFIVYQSNEEKLANQFNSLFESWGLESFYCRQENFRAAAVETYRKILREKLHEARLVVFLLSQEFRWSSYCQSEAGVAMTLKKQRIIITIPPVRPIDIREISPVLEGYNVITSELAFDTNELRKAVEVALKDVSIPAKEKAEKELEKKINYTFDDLKKAYSIRPSKRRFVDVWPSITDTDPEAPRSIVENIKLSILDEKIEVSDLALVGVSLKYSLNLITEALKELSSIPDIYDTFKNRTKVLKITLVHMNAHSHILRSINDQVDVTNIQIKFRETQDKFEESWPKKKELWQKYAQKCGFQLIASEPNEIDYIPPQLGICIDERVLFSGRCAFEEAGIQTIL